MNVSEILNQLGEERSEYFGAMTPPIFQTSNFKFNTVAEIRESLQHEFENHVYTRGNNPTVEILRKKLAALEGAEDALVLSSGMSAISIAVLSVVNAGDHVICVKNVYGWTNSLFSKYLVKFGVATTFVDGKDLESFAKEIRPNTTLIYLESPNTMLFEVQDIESVCKLAKGKSITTIIENTYSTPLYQQPLLMGVDIVVHTATKYLSGHSDVVAGVICSSRTRIEHIFHHDFLTLGAIISPNDAWLFLRGLRTLEIRMDRISESAKEVIHFLENHDCVEQVIYPFSPNNPQLSLVKKQMKGMGGLFSVILKTKEVKKIEAFCNSLKMFHLAVSWGGYESLVFPVCASYYSLEEKYVGALPINLVRLYVALEDPKVLIEDLAQGLNMLK
jgi:cystathionine beta-lyase/cystathionine gamma-synthase